MKRYISLFLISAFACLLYGQTNNKAVEYINRYSPIAISEMQRSGIPASITLAQGLLESGSGTGTLAVKANNHFGIKCHGDWKGESVRHDDDSKAECFRKYATVEESFADHSDFLRYKERYASLFDLEPTDYKGWAYGLKKAGYATDPAYAQKLINLIDAYGLTRFDSSSVAAEAVPQTPSSLAQPERFSGEGRRGTFAVSLSREVLVINGIPFIYARAGETYRSVAALYNLFPRELASFNDSSNPDRRLDAGEPVYLHRKASKAVKGQDKHICVEGESLLAVSQKYAVRLKSLMKLNGITDASALMPEDATLLLRPAKKK